MGLKENIEKAKSIRLMLFDVDGVLTNGQIHYGHNGPEVKTFHVHDGLGLQLLQKSGVEVGIITLRNSDAVKQRMKDLNIKYLYQNVPDKLAVYEELKQKLNLTDENIGYMGDDLPDLPILRRAGLAITVPNAPHIIRDHAHLITEAKGGKGAVREACEFILNAQGTFETVVQEYLHR